MNIDYIITKLKPVVSRWAYTMRNGEMDFEDAVSYLNLEIIESIHKNRISLSEKSDNDIVYMMTGLVRFRALTYLKKHGDSLFSRLRTDGYMSAPDAVEGFSSPGTYEYVHDAHAIMKSIIIKKPAAWKKMYRMVKNSISPCPKLINLLSVRNSKKGVGAVFVGIPDSVMGEFIGVPKSTLNHLKKKLAGIFMEHGYSKDEIIKYSGFKP